MHLLFSLLLAVVPVHGVALGSGPHGTSIVRFDAVTATFPAQTRAVRVAPALRLPPGTGVDAFLDPSRAPWMLQDAHVAARFVAGLPDAGTVNAIDYGSYLPQTLLVDQNGRLLDLRSAFRGKVTIVSFVFTRCPDRDECPAISAKFSALQQRLDPSRFHLVEITLDPVYDSPAILHAYAKQFGADAAAWSIVTGQGHDVAHLLNAFGISSLRVSEARFDHNDKVFLTTPDGKVADIVQTAAFDPAALAAQAEHLAGMSSSVLGRIELALVASAAAMCGGSQFAGIVLLETVVFLLIAVISITALTLIARKIWRNA